MLDGDVFVLLRGADFLQGSILPLLIGICFLAAQPPRWAFSYCEPGSESSRNGLHYGSLTVEGFDRLWRR